MWHCFRSVKNEDLPVSERKLKIVFMPKTFGQTPTLSRKAYFVPIKIMMLGKIIGPIQNVGFICFLHLVMSCERNLMESKIPWVLSEIENNITLLREVGAKSRLIVNFRTLILVGFKMPNFLTDATYNDLKWQPK